MDKKNLPDLSLEKDILNKLELTQEEKEGAEKFLNAITGIKGYDEGLEDIEDNFMPNPKSNITEPQTNSLVQMLSEFLSSYVLTGYDLSGSRIAIWNFQNDLCADACLTHILDVTQECKLMIQQGDYKRD